MAFWLLFCTSILTLDAGFPPALHIAVYTSRNKTTFFSSCRNNFCPIKFATNFPKGHLAQKFSHSLDLFTFPSTSIISLKNLFLPRQYNQHKVSPTLSETKISASRFIILTKNDIIFGIRTFYSLQQPAFQLIFFHIQT